MVPESFLQNFQQRFDENELFEIVRRMSEIDYLNSKKKQASKEAV
jgi:hypothetical protein